jgi:hypothetical protein
MVKNLFRLKLFDDDKPIHDIKNRDIEKLFDDMIEYKKKKYR